MSTTLTSEQLADADSPLGEASNQNESLDTNMLSTPIVDNQLPADLSTDSKSLQLLKNVEVKITAYTTITYSC